MDNDALEGTINRLNTGSIDRVIAEHEGTHGAEILSRLNPDIRSDNIAIQTYESFLDMIHGLDDDFSIDFIVKAFMFSLEHHEGKPYGGAPDIPYACHTTMVGETLFRSEPYSPELVVMGLWHDLLEDTDLEMDNLEKALVGFGSSPENASELVVKIKLLDRTQYEDSSIEDPIERYLKATKAYYEGIKSSNYGDVIACKGADLVINMRRWVNNREHLLRERPHLLGKYIFETEQHLQERDIERSSYHIAGAITAIKSHIISLLSPEEEQIVIRSSFRYGSEARNIVMNFLYVD